MSKTSSKGSRAKPLLGGGIFARGGYETSSETDLPLCRNVHLGDFIYNFFFFFFFPHGFPQIVATG